MTNNLSRRALLGTLTAAACSLACPPQTQAQDPVHQPPLEPPVVTIPSPPVCPNDGTTLSTVGLNVFAVQAIDYRGVIHTELVTESSFNQMTCDVCFALYRVPTGLR